MKIILASTSPYRKMLLERFGFAFDTIAPETDETPLPGESPEQLVRRLSFGKAAAVSDRFPGALVIGSDQVAECDGRIAGKPGGTERAVEQLLSFSGRTVRFMSAFCVLRAEPEFRQEGVSVTEVCFRGLDEAEIRRYIERDKPFDCAGSFRSEAGGSTLLSYMKSDDPTSIMGLPLIRIAECLRAAGLSLP